MEEEIKALREEVARLSERVAVLESRPAVPFHDRRIGPASPGHGAPWPPPTLAPPSPFTIGDPPGWWLSGPTARN